MTLPADDDTQNSPISASESKLSLQYLFTETVKTVPEMFNGTDYYCEEDNIRCSGGDSPPLQVRLADVTDR